MVWKRIFYDVYLCQQTLDYLKNLNERTCAHRVRARTASSNTTANVSRLFSLLSYRGKGSIARTRMIEGSCRAGPASSKHVEMRESRVCSMNRPLSDFFLFQSLLLLCALYYAYVIAAYITRGRVIDARIIRDR